MGTEQNNAKTPDTQKVKFIDNRKIGVFFFVVAAIIIGVNLFLRIYDAKKSAEYKHVDGVVSSIDTRRTYYARKYRYKTTVSVRYSPEGTGLNEFVSYSGSVSYFIKEGDVCRVYYDDLKPWEAYAAEKDWLTGGYVHAGREYNIPLVIAAVIFIFGFYFFADGVYTAKHGIDPASLEVDPKGRVYSKNTHEIARMFNRRRKGRKLAKAVGLSGTSITAATGFVIAYFITRGQNPGYLQFAAVTLVLGLIFGAVYAIYLIHENKRKRRFIAGFMADDATAVYKDRAKAGQILWKHVNEYMFSEPMYSRFSYDYSGFWLEKYKNELECCGRITGGQDKADEKAEGKAPEASEAKADIFAWFESGPEKTAETQVPQAPAMPTSQVYAASVPQVSAAPVPPAPQVSAAPVPPAPQKKIKLGDIVTVTVDRPLGSYHPEHKDMYYPINYGYIEGVIAADGEEQDAYILGVDEPVKNFTGEVIGIVHRDDDVETKLVVAPQNSSFTSEQIMSRINFTEKYYKSHLVMKLKDIDVDPEDLIALGFKIREGHYCYYLSMDETPSKETLLKLFDLLTIEQELMFWNFYRRTTINDPGEYITAFVDNGKAIMYRANHGWSSGYLSISIDDLIELVQRNWDKDCDTRKDFVNSIEIRKVPYPERMREILENPEGTFVPDYSQTAW